MSFIAGLLTFILVINCLVLILLVLVQLPKKDAGAGIAFGGGAADALFGAGSGNALTRSPNMPSSFSLRSRCWLDICRTGCIAANSNFAKQVQQQQMQTPIAAPPSAPPSVAPAAATTTTNLLTMPLITTTNAPVTTTPAK